MSRFLSPRIRLGLFVSFVVLVAATCYKPTTCETLLADGSTVISSEATTTTSGRCKGTVYVDSIGTDTSTGQVMYRIDSIGTDTSSADSIGTDTTAGS